MYCNYFKKVPSTIVTGDLNFSKCLNYLEKNYSEKNLIKHSVRLLDSDTGKYYDSYSFLILKNNILIYMDRLDKNKLRLEFLFQEEMIKSVETLAKELIRFKLRNSKQNHIHLVIPATHRGFDKSPIRVNKPKIKLETRKTDTLEFKIPN